MERSSLIKKSKIGEDEEVPTPPSRNRKGSPENGKQVGVDEDEEECKEDSNSRQNPLGNSVILNRLFRFCGAKDLSNCRLVCKQWYQESLVTWRTDFPIVFTMGLLEDSPNDVVLVNHSNEQNREFYLSLFAAAREPYPATDEFCSCGGADADQEEGRRLHVRLQKFLDYCENSKNQCSTKPYRYIKIDHCEFSLNPEQFGMFWEALGSNLTTLHLYKCTFKDAEEFRKIIYTACPNLQTLNLDRSDFTELKKASIGLEYVEPLYGKHKHMTSLLISLSDPHDFVKTPLPIPWLEMFSHFQSLTHLTYDFYEVRSQYTEEFDRLTDAIRIVRQHNQRALPFKCVDLGHPLEISLFPLSQRLTEIVKELRLPLKSLNIKVHHGMDEDRVKGILDFHAETVRKMRVFGATSSSLIQLFPFGLQVQLNNLRILEIEEELCKSLTFLKYTPNLRLLVIAAKSMETEMKIVSNSCKDEMAHVRMTHLRGLRLGGAVTDPDLVSLIGWMPNIKDLGMPLTDKQFGMICENWKYMIKLTVKGNHLTDAGVTGMAPEEAIRPNITNLQSLEYFEFSSDHPTEESVFRGFLRLPRLRELKFWSMNLRWGKEARDALEEKNVVLHEMAIL